MKRRTERVKFCWITKRRAKEELLLGTSKSPKKRRLTLVQWNNKGQAAFCTHNKEIDLSFPSHPGSFFHNFYLHSLLAYARVSEFELKMHTCLSVWGQMPRQVNSLNIKPCVTDHSEEFFKNSP